jgi:hypothetical protein
MLHQRSAEEARQYRRAIQVNGHEYVLSAYVGAAPVRGTYVDGNEVNDNALPQGFLVEQPPASVTPPHFHEVNQFQVVVAGAEGLTYFTLRAAWDPGAKYMPKSRDRLKKGHQRQKLGRPVTPATPETLRALSAPETLTLIDREEDGMAAWLMRIAPGAAAPIPDPADGGGQYHVVVTGSLLRDGAEMPRLSCLFATTDEPAYEACAGAEGLEMLVLQFPKG